MQEPQVLAGAEEFTIGEGPVGALLVHGFTGTPQGMRNVGEYLAERGIAVEGIRLPGHGTTWQDLNTKTSADWHAAVDAGFEKVSEGRNEVFIVSLSFGTALAIDLIARNPAGVKGLVSLAGFVETKDPRRHLAGVLRHLLKSLPGVSNDIADPQGAEIAYDRLPAKAGYHMLKAITAAKSLLPAVNCPALIMHGRNDHTVPPFNAELIFEGISSSDKELVWLERSYHVITLDYDREEVLRRTFDFIRERSDHEL